MEKRGCKNGNSLDEYPDEFRGAQRLGVNQRGKVEYMDDDSIFEVIFEVHSDSIADLQKHNPLGETPEEHIKNSQEQFGDWWFTETLFNTDTQE